MNTETTMQVALPSRAATESTAAGDLKCPNCDCADQVGLDEIRRRCIDVLTQVAVYDEFEQDDSLVCGNCGWAWCTHADMELARRIIDRTSSAATAITKRAADVVEGAGAEAKSATVGAVVGGREA